MPGTCALVRSLMVVILKPPSALSMVQAACTVENTGGGFTITTIKLRTRVQVADIDEQEFQRIAEETKQGCPVSRALAGVDIQLEATLEK